jgi:hypothetical protein
VVGELLDDAERNRRPVALAAAAVYLVGLTLSRPGSVSL